MKNKILNISLIITFLMLILVTLTGCGSDEPERKTTEESKEENSIISNSTEKTDSYVGYYADIDGDGTVDGVIYADLVTGATGSGEFIDGAGKYTIPTIDSESAKDYYISQANYEGRFGTKDVLTSKGEGKDRFYVMAMEEFNSGTSYCWYRSAGEDSNVGGNMNDYSTTTSDEFGTGKANTLTMIEKWNTEAYGAKDASDKYNDMWGAIQEEVKNGWFVPSKTELCAFAEELNLRQNNYGLQNKCWSSSQRDEFFVWRVGVRTVDFNGAGGSGPVRLSTTF